VATDPEQDALRRHGERVRTLKKHAAVYTAGVVSITAAWAATGPSSMWVVWPLLFWTQILLAHVLVTYLRRPVPDAELECGEHDR